jgi:hypothetical protein
MDAVAILLDGFGRIRDEVPGLVEGLTSEQLGYRPDPGANSIAWLVWHLTRVEDEHLGASLGATDEVWTTAGWARRFGLDLPDSDNGYGHGPDQVAKVIATAEVLAGYHAAVAERTVGLLAALTPARLDEVIDRNWDPPVTLAVRLVSILGDEFEHVGQAAYLKGLLERS